MADSKPILARFREPTAATPTRIAVLSDLHVSVTETGTWRVSHRTEERLEATVDSLNDRDVDGVVFVGDLVQSGARPEYEAFDRVVERLDHPLYALPGNHDLIDRDGRDSLSLSAFERRYTPGELPYHERIGGVDLLALNSNRSTHDAIATSYTGRIAADSLAWLADKLATVETPLVAVHHTLPGTRSILMDTLADLPVTGGSPDFENADELVDVLERGDAPLVLTGHVHFPAVATMGDLREFTLPSLGPYPNAYTVLEIDERGTTAFMHPIGDHETRRESYVHGREHCRVMIAAMQLAGLPLRDELSVSG